MPDESDVVDLELELGSAELPGHLEHVGQDLVSEADQPTVLDVGRLILSGGTAMYYCSAFSETYCLLGLRNEKSLTAEIRHDLWPENKDYQSIIKFLYLYLCTIQCHSQSWAHFR